MNKIRSQSWMKSFFLFVVIVGAALGISMMLAQINDDNNNFAMGIFILAVALVARETEGYFWGVAASVAGTFCVNYFFTYPFWTFDITYPGYPLTMAVMLVVSVLISTLTTQIKKQEQYRLERDREKMHADLLRSIAHDIRTPLASILGASSALQEQKLSPEDQASLISGIHKEAQWLVKMTENLLSVTRVRAGEVKLKMEDEVLEEIIGSAVLKYHQSPDALPVKVESTDEIIIVPADGILLEQVLINLFDNVSAHAKGAKCIWLHIRPEKNKVTLSVEDDGEALPASRYKQILDGSYAQSDRALSDDRRNMGIGLSLCRSIIQAHGGQLSASGSSHGGSAFRFELPRKEEFYGSESAQ